jgi:phosphoglycolate phosphatase
VVSNKRGHLLRLEAAELGWDKYFQSLVGAADAERDKPAPEIVDFALAGSGIAAGPAVWFVGDTDIDVLCAQNSGCTAVLVREAPPGPDEFKGLGLAAHVRDCAGFAELALNSLESGGVEPHIGDFA